MSLAKPKHPRRRRMPAEPRHPERFALLTRQAMAVAVADRLSMPAVMVWAYLRSWLADPRAPLSPTVEQLPSKRAIAAELGLANGTLYRAFAALEAAGWIRPLTKGHDGVVRYAVQSWQDLAAIQDSPQDDANCGKPVENSADEEGGSPTSGTQGLPPVGEAGLPRMGDEVEQQKNEKNCSREPRQGRGSVVLAGPVDFRAFEAACEARERQEEAEEAERSSVAERSPLAPPRLAPGADAVALDGYARALEVHAQRVAGWPSWTPKDRDRVVASLARIEPHGWLSDPRWAAGAVLDAAHRIAHVSRAGQRMRSPTALSRVLVEPLTQRWPEARQEARRAAGSQVLAAHRVASSTACTVA